jgi:hypothetical protein
LFYWACSLWIIYAQISCIHKRLIFAQELLNNPGGFLRTIQMRRNKLYFLNFPGEENFTLKPNDQMDFRSVRAVGWISGINADPIQNFNRDGVLQRR